MMPVMFIGHGSPMNAIEDNEFTRSWKRIAESIPVPSAILCVSAHWLTKGTRVSTLEDPQTIHDFSGFPKALFDVEYPAKGSPELAAKTLDLLSPFATGDSSWGTDHGTWSVLHIMYPDADIPVFQLSIDRMAKPEELFEIGRKLQPLRKENVLILGSGNIVHNLRMVDFSVKGGFPWAETFDRFIADKVGTRDFDSILSYGTLGEAARLAVPTTEHFNPLLYVLGAASPEDAVTVYNDTCIAGSLSMTSYVFASKDSQPE
ncbi:MAG TPA: 4,5-DOPA dioxygenase extradiol [Clostridiaceae bacterium]|nr:4,5-DOPA dioxygenase extradiol [Clostridiaceae bacterium]